MSQQTKNINTILTDDHSPLSELINRAKALSQLDQKLEKMVDARLRGRFKLGAYNKGILSLLADNGSTATELRYQVPDLLQALRKEPIWSGLVQIQIKVHHHWQAMVAAPKIKEPDPIPNDPLSDKTIQHLKALASDMEDDPNNKALAKSIKNLIQSSEKRKDNL